MARKIIKMTRTLIAVATIAIFGLVISTGFPTPVAYADTWDQLQETTCKNIDGKIDSPNCPGMQSKNPVTGPNGFILRVARVVAIIAGIAAIIVIIVGGMRYMLANGDAQKAASARNAVVGALIGLFIIAISSLIIMFVLSRIK